MKACKQGLRAPERLLVNTKAKYASLAAYTEKLEQTVLSYSPLQAYKRSTGDTVPAETYTCTCMRVSDEKIWLAFMYPW